eukprot:g5039.t1
MDEQADRRLDEDREVAYDGDDLECDDRLVVVKGEDCDEVSSVVHVQGDDRDLTGHMEEVEDTKSLTLNTYLSDLGVQTSSSISACTPMESKSGVFTQIFMCPSVVGHNVTMLVEQQDGPVNVVFSTLVKATAGESRRRENNSAARMMGGVVGTVRNLVSSGHHWFGPELSTKGTKVTEGNSALLPPAPMSVGCVKTVVDSAKYPIRVDGISGYHSLDTGKTQLNGGVIGIISNNRVVYMTPGLSRKYENGHYGSEGEGHGRGYGVFLDSLVSIVREEEQGDEEQAVRDRILVLAGRERAALSGHFLLSAISKPISSVTHRMRPMYEETPLVVTQHCKDVFDGFWNMFGGLNVTVAFLQLTLTYEDAFLMSATWSQESRPAALAALERSNGEPHRELEEELLATALESEKGPDIVSDYLFDSLVKDSYEEEQTRRASMEELFKNEIEKVLQPNNPEQQAFGAEVDDNGSSQQQSDPKLSMAGTE